MEYHYLKLANDLESKIRLGRYKAGEKLPSLRVMRRQGLVLYCSSFTKTLAPDLRIGWTVPGRFREKIKRVKFNSSVASQQLMQDVIAGFRQVAPMKGISERCAMP